jgi:hypothetical protein
MKKNVWMAAFLVAQVCSVFAQKPVNYYPDSIRLEFADKNTLIVAELREYARTPRFLRDFPVLLSEWMGYIQKSTPTNFAEGTPQRIRLSISADKETQTIGLKGSYNVLSEGERIMLNIEPNSPSTKVVIREKMLTELFPPGWEMRVTSKNYQITIYSDKFENITSLTSSSFEEMAKAIDESREQEYIGRKAMHARLVVRKGAMDRKQISYEHPGDMLEISPSAGFGFVQDKFYPELNASTMIVRYNRFRKAHLKYGVVYNNLFFTERTSESFHLQTNSFVGLMISKNFSKENGSWVGLGISYLIRNRGNYFEDKTIKISLVNEMRNSRVDIVPELYLTNDFKKPVFGIKMNYSF